MVARVLDIYLEEQLIRERRVLGINVFDEVWDGVYVIPPVRDDEHQKIVGFLTTLLWPMFQEPGRGKVRTGICLSDSPGNWMHNFRIPDVVVFLTRGAEYVTATFGAAVLILPSRL